MQFKYPPQQKTIRSTFRRRYKLTSKSAAYDLNADDSIQELAGAFDIAQVIGLKSIDNRWLLVSTKFPTGKRPSPPPGWPRTLRLDADRGEVTIRFYVPPYCASIVPIRLEERTYAEQYP